MKSTKHQRAKRSAKAGRGRRHRADDAGRHDDTWHLSLSSGPLDVDVLRQALMAATSVPDMPWRDAAERVLPLLRRAHHPFPLETAPFILTVSPGIRTGFGIDHGPAFSHVSGRIIERWGVEPMDILAVALDNLRRRVVVEPPVVEIIRPDGIETIVVQAQGWASSLVLVPDRLGPILGGRERTILTPVRNVLLALSDGADVDLAAGLWESFADGANDELDADPLRWTGSTIVSFGDPGTGRLN